MSSACIKSVYDSQSDKIKECFLELRGYVDCNFPSLLAIVNIAHLKPLCAPQPGSHSRKLRTPETLRSNLMASMPALHIVCSAKETGG